MKNPTNRSKSKPCYLQLTRDIKGVNGFLFSGINVGIKDNTLDFGCIHSEVPANAHAVFTQNLFKGAPVLVAKEHIKDSTIQTLVVNSKNANVFTQKRGKQDALKICRTLAKQLNLSSHELILPASTGVIGQYLPIKKILQGCDKLVTKLSSSKKALENFAQAILTTDQFPKWMAVKIGGITLVGIAKGAGMMQPNMATMLTYFITDAKINQTDLKKIFNRAMDLSFNAITVDGDTSTSDTAVILANGCGPNQGKVDLIKFEKALTVLSQHLAKEIVRDGEGTKKVIELTIKSAASLHQADLIAKSVLNSPLVKTAIAGSDPNWGRIIMAIGKVASRVKPKEKIDPDKVKVYSVNAQNKKDRILLTEINSSQKLQQQKLIQLKKYFQQDEIHLEIQLGYRLKEKKTLGFGNINKTFWGCDFNENYIRLNADYTT